MKSRGRREKLVLLNPPGRRVYLRDYYCSKVSQADYIHHPIDLVFLSGYLSQDYELELVDAIVEKLGPEKCLQRLGEIGPQVVVGLIGSVSYHEDVPFYRGLGEGLPSARLFLVGDVLIERRQERLSEMPFAEGFVHDFSSPDLLRHLRGAPSLRNLTLRRKGVVEALPLERLRGATFRLPRPEHRLFLDRPYRYPFVRRSRFATVMTDFGCPYRCSFCIMSRLGWKQRPVDDVLEELKELGRMGVGELFFLDQTFGIPRSRSLELLEGMRRLPHRFGWVCFSRPDLVDDALAARMKSAGCHTVILGLESGSQQLLDAVCKDARKEEILQGFRRCSSHGLRTVATVLLGLPEETEETFQQTLDFLRQADPDFASFNVAVPRLGTPFREKALRLGLIDREFEVMDQSGSPVAMPTLTLDRRQVAAMRRRAVRSFYGRPGYWRKRLSSWARRDGALFSDLRIQLQQGYRLLCNYLAS